MLSGVLCAGAMSSLQAFVLPNAGRLAVPASALTHRHGMALRDGRMDRRCSPSALPGQCRSKLTSVGMGLSNAMLATATAIPLKVEPSLFLASVIVAAVGAVATWLLNRPSRTFTEAGVGGTVGNEYDAWTEEGILEYYWGEHIHLGYYDQDDLNAITNPLKSGKVFKDTKFKFVEEMYKWSGAEANSGGAPAKILDVGCGIGGTSRYLGNKLKGKGTQVTGITLSPKQVERATELAQERGLDNVKFQVMDALKMDFPDNTFDLVWGCESGEHMPDKAAYVEEMTRVLKPGGTLVIATWCQRELAQGEEFTKDEKAKLQFLYDEWAHPYFISIEEYERLCTKTGKLDSVSGANWVKETIAAWRHSIWVGVWDPWIVIWKGFTSRMGPRVWWKTIREIVTLERMHRAFDCGLMTYGMIKARKQA